MTNGIPWVWVAATLLAPLAARETYRRLGPRLADWDSEIAFWARAGYGVLPLYLAWITGAVIGWDSGISGFSLATGLPGIAAIVVLLGALALALRLEPLAQLARLCYDPEVSRAALFDEPRWAFYRGAGAAVLADPAAAQVIGLTLGAAEWLIRGGRPSRRRPPRVWADLVRLGVSAGFFALTHNLWLVLLAQAGVQALVARSRNAISPPA